jgi:hypothetical protein
LSSVKTEACSTLEEKYENRIRYQVWPSKRHSHRNFQLWNCMTWRRSQIRPNLIVVNIAQIQDRDMEIQLRKSHMFEWCYSETFK